MPQKRNPVETRQRILNAAIHEFSAKGLNGARIDVIAKRARSNSRMLYHYFGGKERLYLASLEQVLSELRMDELKLDMEGVDPLTGLLQLFEFTQKHFENHPELVSLMSAENILKAKYLKKSKNLHERSSSVLALIGELLARGERLGVIRAGLDPLYLYVSMVSLSYFHLSNAYTLGTLFRADLQTPAWRAGYEAQARAMFMEFLQTTPASC